MPTSIRSENTVLYFVHNKTALKALKEAAKQNSSNLKKIKFNADVFGIPCYCMVLECMVAGEELIENVIENAGFSSEQELLLITIGEKQLPLSKLSKVKVMHYTLPPSAVEFERVIKKAKSNATGYIKRVGETRTKIRRAILLYKEAFTGVINIDRFCAEHSITERTMRRDIRMLKDLLPEQNFYTSRKWTR